MTVSYFLRQKALVQNNRTKALVTSIIIKKRNVIK